MVDITKIKAGDKVVFYEDGTLCTVVAVDGNGLIVKAGKETVWIESWAFEEYTPIDILRKNKKF
jgi:preprotein translocase subunit YajC